MQKNGFVGIYLVLIIGITAILGFGYQNYKSKNITTSTSTPNPTTSPSSTPSPSPSPTPKPVITKKPTTPSPKPTMVAQNNCSQFKPEDGLTSIKITLKEKDGKPLVGDWVVKIKPAGDCPGILPPMWGSQINEVIRQGTYTYTSPNIGAGKFRVDVNYHFTGEGFDWDGISGNHTREITVSN